MKRIMKKNKYSILMVVGMSTLILLPFSPCRAGWVHIYSDVSSGPNQDDDYDSDSGAPWSYEWWWSYEVSSPDRSAGSSGVSASGDCSVNTGGQVSATGEANPYIAVYKGCSVWGYSAYVNTTPEDPNAILTYSWSMSGSGEVSAGGGISDDNLGEYDSAFSSSASTSGIDADQSGSAYAEGYVSNNSNGEAEVSISGDYTTEGSSTVYDDEDGWYSASLSFSVYGSDEDDVSETTSWSVTASIGADASSGAEVYVSQGYSGSAHAGSSASFDGSCSVGVSF